jgi:hypothetical protein
LARVEGSKRKKREKKDLSRLSDDADGSTLITFMSVQIYALQSQSRQNFGLHGVSPTEEVSSGELTRTMMDLFHLATGGQSSSQTDQAQDVLQSDWSSEEGLVGVPKAK